MILANLRARLVPTDADVVVELLSEGDAERERGVRKRLHTEGIDALLDDPALVGQLRATDHLVGLSPAVFIYVTVGRQAPTSFRRTTSRPTTT